MRIRMRTLQSGPQGIRYPDVEYTVDDNEGKELCAAGYAEPIAQRQKETATVAAPEVREVTSPNDAKPKKKKGK